MEKTNNLKKHLIKKLTISMAVSVITVSYLPTIVGATAEDAESYELENAINSPVASKDVTSATVSNFTDFKAALKSSIVKNIYLANDITIEDNIDFQLEKNIYGENHTINVNNKNVGIMSENTEHNIENVTFINQGVYSFFWSEKKGVTVNYKNINSSGAQFIYLSNGTANLSGEINVNVDKEEVFQGGQLNILENAKVIFNDSSSLFAIRAQKGLKQAPNSELTVKSKGVAIRLYHDANMTVSGKMNLFSSDERAIWNEDEGGSLIIEKGAELIAAANEKNHEAILIKNGSVEVKSGGTLEVSSIGHEATLQTGNHLLFEEGSNFSITNSNPKGTALGSYTKKTDVGLSSIRGVNTWALNNPSEEPTNTYKGPLDATFTLLGYEQSQQQTNMISNNQDFKMKFQSGQVRKITGGKYVHSISQTTIDELDVKSTQVTGRAEPNAAIVVRVGSEEIGKGEVDSNGQYSILISPKPAGTKVTAVAMLNGESSEASTIVKF